MPERALKCLDGKRGAFLLVGAVSYLFIGLSYVFASTASRDAAFRWLPDAMSPTTLGWLWVVGGITAAIIALRSAAHPRWEATGFGALMLCPSLWVVIFLGASMFGTHPHGWISAVAYGLMAMWVWVVSGWENPHPPVTGPVRTVVAGE